MRERFPGRAAVHAFAPGTLAVCCLLVTAASAQQLALPPFRGAGEDPRTAIAQPETTSQASGGSVGSVEPSLGPLGDPLGVRPVLKQRGIEYWDCPGLVDTENAFA